MNKPFNLEAALAGEELVVVCGSSHDIYNNRKFVVTGFDPNYYGNRTLVATDVDPNALHNTLHIQMDGKINWVGQAYMAPKKVTKSVYVNLASERGTYGLYETEYDAARAAEAQKGVWNYIAVAVPAEVTVEE